MNWKNLELKQDELEKSCFDSDLIKTAKNHKKTRKISQKITISTLKTLRKNAHKKNAFWRQKIDKKCLLAAKN